MLDRIEDALEDLRAGKSIIVVDDENRENEGDIICAAEFATLENVNLMAAHARGLICMPMSQEYIENWICLKCAVIIQIIIVQLLLYL